MMVGVPTRSGNTLRFPWEAAEPSAYRTYQWNILEAFLAQNIFVRRSIFFGYEQKLLISTAGGRFHFITVQGRHLFKKTTFTESTLPRALLEPPCASHSGVSRLMGLHYRSSHRRPFAIPAGQGRLRQRYIARRKSVCIFEESPPSVPINGVVLRQGKVVYLIVRIIIS